jgi:hypothetical protein
VWRVREHRHCERKRSNPWRRECSKRRVDCFVARAPRNDGWTRLRDLAEWFFREVFIYSRPLRIEGAGNAGRPMRPAVSCARWGRKRTRAYRSHRNHPAFPTQWFTDYTALSPVLRAFWPPSPALLLADLTPASGYQDHTSSPSARKRPRQKRPLASTASCPALVTLANAPHSGTGRGEYSGDLHF